MRTRIRFLAFVLSLSLAACGGGSPDPAQGNQGGGGGGGAGGGGGGGAGGGGSAGGGGATPVLFTDNAADLGKAGAFPSDLILDAAGTIFTVDDAMIPANLVSVPSGVRVPITANDLVDMDGIRPARSVTTLGSGLFGAFTGDLEFAFDRWLFVTVSAGNSVSSDGANSLRLANLLLIDRQAGVVVQTINLAWPLQRGGSFSTAGTYTVIPQSLPVMCAFVPNPNGTQTGKVHVAMSNGAGSTAGLTNFFEGTIQEWRVDFTAFLPITPETAGRDPTDVTRTRVTAHHNPVGLTPYRAASGVDYLILTAAGASLFDPNGVVHAVSDAYLEFLDLDTGIWRDNLAANLGDILPSTQSLALGEDAQGTTFGLLTSQTRSAAYFVDLEGLESNPPDPTRIGLLRTVSIVPGGATTDGSGFLPGVGLTASSRTAVISSFFPAALHVLALPEDIAFGTIVVAPPPFDVADLESEEAFGLGALAVATTPGTADVFVVVNGNFDANFLPLRHGFVGTLTTGGRLP